MSNQFGTSKNPPWARQEYSSQGAAGIIQTSVTYPYNQTQAPYPQQQLAPGGTNLQATQATLLSQAGLTLPTPLTGAGTQIGAISYPAKAQTSAAAIPSQKQRIFTGTITKMHENFGFVDEEVFFQVNCVKGMVPKVGDRVLVEATYNANMPFKWNATRVISLSDTVTNTQMITLQQQQQQQQQQQLKTIQQQAIGIMNTSGMLSSLSSLAGGQGLISNQSGPPPLMSGLGKFQSGGIFSTANRSGINTGPGLLGDPSQRNVKDQRGLSAGGSVATHDSQKERDRRERERRDRREARRKRSRSPVKRSHSPPPRARSPRSPPKRKTVLPPPRYVVQVPKILLDVKETCVISLKSKYSNLYIPSDFFHASFSWVENFPLSRPFTLGQACSFQIMHKDVPPIKQEPVVYEPDDADHLFSAKVMLLASLSEEELYKKSCCLAEDMPDCMDNFQHPTRLLQFLVGTRGKNEPMAIGGPWSPSLDGANPQSNPLVLIKTAIRTTKALTGIDLSSCTQWYRFAEIRYFRAESRHKERVQPARVETVVIFLPDVWTCNPTRLEWISIQAAYHKLLQQKLNPGQQQEEDETEEQEVEEKTEPTHYSTLDPKVMKVREMRRELELRNISHKGLKSQLTARLAKALKLEQEKEQDDKEIEAEKAAEEEAAREEEKEIVLVEDDEEIVLVQDDDKSENKKKEDEEQQRKEKREKAVLERRYKLSDTPSVLVHPSPLAKGGKFDCSVMSLSLLLDYRPEDNKEHSFEVSLFAELFNEMLMRDFGFQIYKSIVCAPAKGETEKKKVKDKDEKKDTDEKNKEEKKERKEDKKEEKKSSKDKNDEPSPKRKKSEDRADRNDRKDQENSTEEGSLNGGDVEDKEDEERKDKDDRKKKKDEEKRKKTTNPSLLLAFSYFDQNHCGYITDKDTEEIIHTLGLKLSRAQIKKVLHKVLQRDNFYYRKLTDHEVGDDSVCVKAEQEESSSPKLDVEQLAKGNKESLRKLLELSGVKLESSSSGLQVSSSTSDSSNPNFLYYKGALLDIESLMQRLDRSEKSRTALEKNLQDLTDELKTVKTHLVEQENASSKLQHDLRKTRADLDQEKSSCNSAQSLNKEWQRTALETRSHMMSALNSLNSVLTKDEGRHKNEEHRSKTEENRSKNEENRSKNEENRSKTEEHRSKNEENRSKTEENRSKNEENRSKTEEHRSKTEEYKKRDSRRDMDEKEKSEKREKVVSVKEEVV